MDEDAKQLREFDDLIVKTLESTAFSTASFKLEENKKVLVVVDFDGVACAKKAAEQLYKSTQTNIALEERHWKRFGASKYVVVNGAKLISEVIATLPPCNTMTQIKTELETDAMSLIWLFFIILPGEKHNIMRPHFVRVKRHATSGDFARLCDELLKNKESLIEALKCLNLAKTDNKEKPPVVENKGSCCVCEKDDAKFKCGTCKVARYCSKECQVRHVKAGNHTKKQCAFLSLYARMAHCAANGI